MEEKLDSEGDGSEEGLNVEGGRLAKMKKNNIKKKVRLTFLSADIFGYSVTMGNQV